MTPLTQPFGLGDLAYYAFRPVVHLIDWIWGTDLRDCSVCKKRRKLWNSYGTVPLWVVLFLGALFLVTTGGMVLSWGE